MSDTPLTRKAYQSMGKCLGGIRYIPIIKFLIGLYHKEKGKAQYFEARLKEATNGQL